MREPVGTFEAPRGVGECSKEEIQDWGAIVSEYTSEDWPPVDWSVSPEVEREESLHPTSENAVKPKFGIAPVLWARIPRVVGALRVATP
jgi:hypothetical protein